MLSTFNQSELHKEFRICLFIVEDHEFLVRLESLMMTLHRSWLSDDGIPCGTCLLCVERHPQTNPCDYHVVSVLEAFATLTGEICPLPIKSFGGKTEIKSMGSDCGNVVTLRAMKQKHFVDR